MWERKRTLCPPPSNSPRCHGTNPFPSRVSPDVVSSPLAAERCGRLHFAAFFLLLHVPGLGLGLPADPAPVGGAREQALGGSGEFSVVRPLPETCGRTVPLPSTCQGFRDCLSSLDLPPPPPQVDGADISTSQGASQPLSRPLSPVSCSVPCVRLVSPGFAWVSASGPDVVSGEVAVWLSPPFGGGSAGVSGW